MPERARKLGWMLGALMVLLAGCAQLRPDLTPPDVRLLDVRLREGGLMNQIFDVRLRVTNMSDVTLPVEGLIYRINLDGREFASGALAESFTLAPLATQTVTMTMATNLLASAGYVIQLLEAERESVAYEVEGSLKLARRFTPRLPFHHNGTVSLAPPPRP